MSSASLCCAHLRALPFCAIVSVSMRVRTLHTHPHTHKPLHEPTAVGRSVIKSKDCNQRRGTPGCMCK